jgi:hypothetical protein
MTRDGGVVDRLAEVIKLLIKSKEEIVKNKILKIGPKYFKNGIFVKSQIRLDI